MTTQSPKLRKPTATKKTVTKKKNFTKGKTIKDFNKMIDEKINAGDELSLKDIEQARRTFFEE